MRKSFSSLSQKNFNLRLNLWNTLSGGYFFDSKIIDKCKQGAIINSMSEYKQQVEKQRQMLLAEEWAKSISDVHVHSLSSMWYDDRPQDTADGKSVTDIAYNSGVVKRTLDDGTEVFFGNHLKGEDLLQEYQRKFGGSILK